MSRHELIARLEAATGPDVSLDIAIHSFINAGKRIRTDMHGFPVDVDLFVVLIEFECLECLDDIAAHLRCLRPSCVAGHRPDSRDTCKKICRHQC